MMTKSKTDRCCGHSTNGASRLVIDSKDAPSTLDGSPTKKKSQKAKPGIIEDEAINSNCGANFPSPSISPFNENCI
jgi:hypothetical protein